MCYHFHDNFFYFFKRRDTMKKLLFFLGGMVSLYAAREMVQSRRLADSEYGTHVCPLITAVVNTDGPILEMGCGDYSTPLLHALCSPKKRMLVSTDTDLQWLSLFLDLENNWHTFYFISENAWDRIGNDMHWSVVLIDHRPALRRVVDIERLRSKTDIFVVHDTELSAAQYYNYETTFSSFKYRYDYKRYATQTTLLSDRIDVEQLFS